MKHSEILEKLILAIPEIRELLSCESSIYKLLKIINRKEIENILSAKNKKAFSFEPFGELIFPYHNMGAVDSLNLFDFDEIILFSFYWKNRNNYRNALDLGANLGLHTIIMSKCGFNVTCYEPDPVHFKILNGNLKLNHINNVNANNKAISFENGRKEFIRVCGNTTGSHLAGAKQNPYGKLDKFQVEVDALLPILRDKDLVKMDVEGHEKDILLNTKAEDWAKTDLLVEIENKENASCIYEHFKKLNINMFPQKIGWDKAESVNGMPASYKEGMLFISRKENMPW